MRRNTSKLFIIFFLGCNLYSFDFSPLDFIIDFPDEITITKIYEPYVEKVSNGQGFLLHSYDELEYNNKVFSVRIFCHIDEDQVSYNKNVKNLLRAYYDGEAVFNVNKLIHDEDLYNSEHVLDRPFSSTYKARDIQYIAGYKSDILFGQDGTKIERDYTFGVWESISAEDKLTYYFRSSKGLYSEYIIEISNIWMEIGEFEDWGEPVLENFDDDGKTLYMKEMYTMTNKQLYASPYQDDPSIQLMHLLNEAMTTFRFKDRPNIPDSNLGTVSSDRVRMRSSYDLDSDILGYVNTDEEVIVMERSPEKQTIGDMYDYWYRVLSKSSYLKGWMYGAFLDLEE
jgi:hypothetical protein